MKRTRGFWIPVLALALAYSLAELLGLRRYTTFLSGTPVGGDYQTSAALGILYLALYFGWTVVCPILALAAVIDEILFAAVGGLKAPQREVPR
ncbi:MAG: hypothetical protein M3Y28_02255 [Armatimonadota bacterium]|nr:hypothetical protein [Armatimonadota bacterium]